MGDVETGVTVQLPGQLALEIRRTAKLLETKNDVVEY